MTSTMGSAIGTPHVPPAIGSMSPTTPCKIRTPINAASTVWRTQLCPNAPLQRCGKTFDPTNIGSAPRTPINKWPSNIGTPMTVFSPLSYVPDPDALRFAICGAKLDLAGASALAHASQKDSEAFGRMPEGAVDSYPVLNEMDRVPVIGGVLQGKAQIWEVQTRRLTDKARLTDTVPVIGGEQRVEAQVPEVQKRRHADKARFATTQPRFASGLGTVPEIHGTSSCGISQASFSSGTLGADPTILDSSPPIDVTEFESPEKLAAPVRSRGRNAQNKHKSKFLTN